MSIKFNSTKECIESLNLYNYINEIKSKSSYGRCFEEILFKKLKNIGTDVTKTTVELDVVRGADYKFSFEKSNVYVDVKLITGKSFHGVKKFVDSNLQLVKDERKMHYFTLTPEIKVAFGIKYFSRLGDIGYCKFNKGVITAVFRCKSSKDKSAHEYIDDSVALSIKELIRIINNNMIDCGDEIKVSNSFEFRYHKKKHIKGGDVKNDAIKRYHKEKGSFKRHQNWNRQSNFKNEKR